LPRATLVVLALAFSLWSVSQAHAAPAGSKPPDNPFDERGGGRGETASAEGEASGDDSADEAKPDATTKDDAVTSEPDAAASAEGKDEDEEEEGGLHALACLEGDATGGRRKGVQRRDFLKRHRFEVAGVGGFYASDALSSTYSYGGAVAFYPSEDFGLEVLVTRSLVKFRLEEPFNAFDNQSRFQPGVAWQGILSLLWSPIHAKFKFSEATIIHGDIFAVAGAGKTFHDSVLGLTWEAGGGLKLYFSRFVTFRLDIRDFLLPQEVLGRGRITNNITILAGFSVWLG
jgi:outer membrane beta-barrel protein